MKRISLFGGGISTGNLGVAALTLSVIDGLATRLGASEIALFDHAGGLGREVCQGQWPSCRVVQYEARWSRRLYRRDAMTNIRWSARLGGLWNPGARAIVSSLAVMDISGGDSFTDLYGMWRYGYVIMPKLIALEARRPLVLLPQTYGPFKTDQARAAAEHIVRSAASAWARDLHSFGILKELLGPRFDARRHRCGVDVAFLLPYKHSRAGDAYIRSSPVGVNISGLIWNQPEKARSQYGFVADYREAVPQVLTAIAERTDRPILLVPHVITPRGHFESDLNACEQAMQRLSPAIQSRILIAPEPSDPRDAKAIISKCSWFLGTRMHATIASLSSGVPTGAISYSDKTLGVFDTCGQGEHVHDPRKLDTAELVRRVVASFEQRESAASSLRQRLPSVLATAASQMDDIVNQAREQVELAA